MRVIDEELTPLEALKTAKSFRLSWDNSDWLNKEDQDYLFDIIETALIRLERSVELNNNMERLNNFYRKRAKALDIITEKEVNIHNFKELIIRRNWTYEQYLDEENDSNTSGYQFAYKLLTQEEFDLLNEALL